MTEDEMVEWHHRVNGHEFEQTLGYTEGQESLVCCSPWGCKESLSNFHFVMEDFFFLVLGYLICIF